LRVIGVEPAALFRAQQIDIDKAAVDRHERQVVKAQIGAFRPGDRPSSHQHQILDADAVLACLVIARLVRQDHAFEQFLRSPGLPALRLGNALGPFVDRKKAADAVPGAMGIVEPRRPQELARQHVELGPIGALREHGARQGDMPLEHAGEPVAHLRRRRAGPIQTVRVMSVVPSRYCPPESTR
jgi:hypothetical protein